MIEPSVQAVVLGTLSGGLFRWLMLRVDYRQYPTYPHAYIAHVSLGLMAAFLGAVSVPALAEENWEAATFVALAMTQFREVRHLERDKLQALDTIELVPRGTTYIEGIAQVFEIRNYLAIAVGTVASLATVLIGWVGGMSTGVVLSLVLWWFKSGKRIGDIASVEIVPVEFEAANLYVGGIYIMNIGLRGARADLAEWARGVMIKPHDENARDTLADMGQRQAVVHDLSKILGMRIDVATPEFTPLARKDQVNGDVAVLVTPMEADETAIRLAVENVPVLEAARGSALDSLIGQWGAD